MDFEVKKFSRRCAETDRELGPGEVFYSVLIPEGADVIRRDYAVDAWEGPPDHAIAWWKSEVPDPNSSRLQWAPNDVMLHYFQQLLSLPEKRDTCYILTLLMIRRRIFRMEANETDGQGSECLLVYCSRNEEEYRVPVAVPTEERASVIQQELAETLYAKGESAK